jgi:adenosine deaminase
MCKDENFHSFLHALPKCEHHMHLEGALTPEVLFQLADKNNTSLPKDDPAFASPVALSDRYDNFTSLDDFLHYYYIGMSVLLTASDFEYLAMDYFRYAHNNGVVHAEVFFDPQAHLARGVSYDTVLEGFMKARVLAEEEFGITSELICCFLRHLPVQECVETFEMQELQRSLKDGRVKGVGLDSSEKAFPPELFTEIYGEAEEMGVQLTAHAGEEGPADYIRSALDDLKVQRIDHGIRLVEDPELLKRVAEEGILLSVCPISNVFLRCVAQVSELPIRKFLDAGVKFSINSDDPAYFGGNYILDNYCAVHEAFNLTVAEWKRICENGIQGSWCSRERKEAMLARLTGVVEAWKEVPNGTVR